MTLAAAILWLTCCITAPQSGASQPAPTQQDSAPAVAQKPPADAPPLQAAPAAQLPPEGKQPAHKKKSRRQKASASNCQPETPAKPNSAAKPDPSSGSQSPAPRNCPPVKTIVRQGGSSEPSIQLAGGPSDEALQKRDAANHMIASAEANLKMIAGRQLSASQQDSVSQIRQFVDQSKAALAVGELERAKTLAWKAALLSQDLVKP